MLNTKIIINNNNNEKLPLSCYDLMFMKQNQRNGVIEEIKINKQEKSF
jgi:hypothetical protein